MPKIKLVAAPPSSTSPKCLRQMDSKLDMIRLSTPPTPPIDKDNPALAAFTFTPASTITDNDIAWKHNAIEKSRGTIHSVHVGLSIDSIHGSPKEHSLYQTSLSPPSIAKVEFIPENLFISNVFERTDAQPFQLQPRPSSK